VDLTRSRLPDDIIRDASLVAFYLPMHTATRLALAVMDRVVALNPGVHLCAYGLYAPLNADILRAHGVQTVLGPEFEDDLVRVANEAGLKARATDVANEAGLKACATDVANEAGLKARATDAPEPSVVGQGFSPASLPRVAFITPDRSDLPPLTKYASLQVGADRKVVGYTEATRGCKHRCRHCPIVPVYDGRFRAVPLDIVIADIREQVAAGAQHITFGDPDFFNGPTHALAIVEALAREFPGVGYDVTIKVEHLRQQAAALPRLRDTGCAFVTTAVESFDDEVLAKLEKGHTHADFVAVVRHCESIGLALSPTFVAFTPWTTLEGYCAQLREIERLNLVAAVSPIQYAIRLLIPQGSRMLELDDVRARIERFDAASLTHLWRHADPRVDALQQALERLVGSRLNAPRDEVFGRALEIAHDAAGIALAARVPLPSRATVPYLNEPWYC
jgi:tRNA A37 methylthiotransferase MiaB